MDAAANLISSQSQFEDCIHQVKCRSVDVSIWFDIVYVLVVKERMLPEKTDSAVTVTKPKRQSQINSLIDKCLCCIN